MRRFPCAGLAFAALTMVLVTSTPCWAQSTAPGTDDAQRLAIEGMDKILKALDLLIQAVPQYAAPEMLENGDIIIRRLHPEEAPKRKPKDNTEDDGTNT